MKINNKPFSIAVLSNSTEVSVSELMVFKANELVVSRYDLTEHETKLMVCGVALLNPTIDNPDEDKRTVTFTYQQYAQMMGLSNDNAYQRLKKTTRELMTRTIQIIDQTGVVSERIFQWVNYAEFNRDNHSVKLRFSKEIVPYLFQLKRFIKYNLENVKAFEHKYSMRVYEWLLKELTQRKTHKANIEISIAEFKFMLMLENNYTEFKKLNHWVLKPITKDLNTYSNIKLVLDKRGRPADTLIFQVELDKQIDFVKELRKLDDIKPSNAPQSYKSNLDNETYAKLTKALNIAYMSNIGLSKFELKFLNDMKVKYDLNCSFSWLSKKQRTTLTKIINKSGL